MGQDEIKNMLKVLGRGLGMLLAALFLSGFEKRGGERRKSTKSHLPASHSLEPYLPEPGHQNKVIRGRSSERKEDVIR